MIPACQVGRMSSGAATCINTAATSLEVLAVNNGLAIDLQQLVLPRLGELEIAEDPAAVEDRLGQAADHAEEGGVRLKQRGQRRALIAALPGQLDAWKELRAGIADIGGRRGKLRFLSADVRALRQQLRRQAGRNPRRTDLVE